MRYFPVYRWLRMFWLCNVIALLCGLISNLLSVFAWVGLLCSIVQFYPFYQLQEVSDRLRRAFQLNIIAVAATVISTLSMLLSSPSVLSGVLYLLLSAVTVAGVIALYVSQFWLYSGLDDVGTERFYDFPPRRIRWCFYLSLINIILRGLPTSIPLYLSQIVSLILLGQFVRAAGQSENRTA